MADDFDGTLDYNERRASHPEEFSRCRRQEPGCTCLDGTGCTCQQYGKSGVPFPSSGKCMICGHQVNPQGRMPECT